MIKIKQGVPTVWRQRYKRYIWNIRQDAKDRYKKKNFRFRDGVIGSYRDKKVLNVLYLFYYMNFEKFKKHQGFYLSKLATIEKYLFVELKQCNEFEKYDEIPSGESYRDYGSLEAIFWTLKYISDRHKCVMRLTWLLDLIKKYKHDELPTLDLMDKGIE